MKTSIIFPDADFEERTTNYIQVANNIADEYGYSHSPLSERLSHGIQKDAIQNGWDALEKKTQKYVKDNWRFEFELREIKDYRILMMMDKGTCGITGNLTSGQLKTLGIAADELPEDERWAKWESFGYTKEQGLGARGQGKLIFMLASKDYTIFYDSLRSDGSYRFGGSTATETGCPVFHYDGQEAKKIIKGRMGIEPLSYQGTRIMIMNPVDDVVQDIQNGNLLRFIEETWWPNILKYGAEITVKHDGKVTMAKVPKYFPITKELAETKTFRTWIKEADDFKKKGLKIKRLCVACDLEKQVDELHQGISCFRDGMKVDVVRFPTKSFRDKVYGYIEFEEELEKELRKFEKPTHYAFKGTLWSKIKNLIEPEIEAFGNKKLGLGIDTQALINIKRSNAESKALSILRAVTKNWSLSRMGKGGGGGGNGGNPPDKDIGVRLSELIFPNPGNVPRIDYGQKLEGFKIVVFNRTEKELNVTLNAFILSGDTKILEVMGDSFILQPKSTKVFSENSIEVNKNIFKNAGVYRFRLNLIDNIKNERIDQITRRLWVETDPELTGPFDVRRYKFAELPEELNINKSKEWVLYAEGDDKYTLYYNIDHPAYLYSHETEGKLTAYLAEVFLWGALELFIRQSLTKEDLESQKEMPLNLELIKSSSPLEVFGEYTLAFSKLREQIYGMV